jgi:hypothetical protein
LYGRRSCVSPSFEAPDRSQGSRVRVVEGLHTWTMAHASLAGDMTYADSGGTAAVAGLLPSAAAAAAV